MSGILLSGGTIVTRETAHEAGVGTVFDRWVQYVPPDRRRWVALARERHASSPPPPGPDQGPKFRSRKLVFLSWSH